MSHSSKTGSDSVFQRFLHWEAAGSVVLLVCALIALVWANSPWAESYHDLTHTYLGISLGDDCVVEAGCYVTAGSKVTVKDMDSKPKVVKASELSGASNVLFRRNSVSGAIEAVPWKGEGISLNADLHAN